MAAENKPGRGQIPPSSWFGPFPPRVIGKSRSQETLAHLQEVPEKQKEPEKPQEGSTPLPPDVMKTVYPRINPT